MSLLRAVSALIALATIAVPSSARALSNCKAKFDRNTGQIEVSATGVQGTPQWSFDLAGISNMFVDQATCLNGGRLRDCHLFDESLPLTAHRSPARCTIFIADSSATVCHATLRDCRPKPSDLTEDGVILIDQALAESGSVTQMDAPGFPVTISFPGSYRLSSNLDVVAESSPADTVVIDVTVPNVTIDLNGFSVLGATVCTGTPVTSCAPTGAGIAIRAPFENVKVSNGNVTGAGSVGIQLGNNGQVDSVRVTHSGGSGILGSANSQILNSTFSNNGYQGIDMTSGAVARGNTARHNKETGIRLLDGAAAKGNTSESNGAEGITVANGSSVLGNASRGNGGDGITTGNGSTVQDNATSGNGGDGIEAGQGSTVNDNSASGNLGYGLRLAVGIGYSQNVISLNSGGTVLQGIQTGTNLCDANTTCP